MPAHHVPSMRRSSTARNRLGKGLTCRTSCVVRPPVVRQPRLARPGTRFGRRDILSLDVVERGTDFAIDDLVVDVEPGKLPDTLLTAAEALPGVTVDSIRPYAGILDTHRELELIDHVAAARDDRIQILVDGAPRVLRVGWATVLGVGPNGVFRIAGEPGFAGDPPRRRPLDASRRGHPARPRR